jgi:hypothetical protein
MYARNRTPATPATPATRPAPVDNGERLATSARGEADELRITWAEFKGYHFLNLRVWHRGPDGSWFPDRARGIAIKLHELALLSDAVTVALDRAADSARNASEEV